MKTIFSLKTKGCTWYIDEFKGNYFVTEDDITRGVTKNLGEALACIFKKTKSLHFQVIN